MENRYQAKWDINNTADFCWTLKIEFTRVLFRNLEKGRVDLGPSDEDQEGPKSVLSGQIPGFCTDDLVAAEVTYVSEGTQRQLVVCSAYLPYDKKESPPTRELRDLVAWCEKEKKQLIVGCDANSHHTVWGSSDVNDRVVKMEHKREHPPFFKSVRNYFREYCNYSSIHGFRYFGEKRTYFERGWWFVVFAITLAACIVAIREVYQKWVRSPVIVSFATRETPIYKIPFPAVTICPETKSKQKLYNHTEIIRKLIEDQNLTSEEGWWFVVFAITLAACIVAIREVYQKWVRSPVIVSFATRETPIYKIPFPAVTICPETKSKQKLYNHTEIIRKLIEDQNLTSEERKLYDYMGLICKEEYGHDFSQADTFDEDFFKELENISYINTLYSCSYMGKYYSCATIFKPIITDEGICFTFNMLDRSEIYRDNVVHYENYHVMENLTYSNWSMDDGYSEDAGLYPYPHRALLAGAKNSLTINLITAKENIDHTCKESIQGYRVLLHIPMRIPSLSKHYFRVALDQVALGNIQPVMITTSESVMLYNSKRRECFFPSEKQLKFFKIYTSLNCKLECLTNFTLQYCGCVNFFMPRENTTKICGIGKLECMKQAEDLLQMGTLQNKIEVPKNKSTNSNCNCMPICSDLSYDVEISQNDWRWIHLYRALNINGTFKFKEDDFHFSRLTLFFKSSQFITSQRHELYGPTDFLANFGGLLGLFTGFSVLSLMEAIYFLTVRLCCNSRLYGYWAGRET
ncbi:pickpocket protein 28-like [Anoplophora glabripennis]|uniref:pickpocket protein 28-like n=1 Tax=Anoplophora glabripennis TaxID=217634 RepID=UPI000C793BCB|nr:pickpocket protein 28-like [Anoplophora glabripennis]